MNTSEVTIKPNSSLTIYMDGDLVVASNSNVNNLTRDPKKLTIYSTVSSNGKGVNIANEGDFYGAVYAPGTGISIANNGNFFGAFVGNDFIIPNRVKLHYDEALAGKISDSDIVWREISAHLVP